MDEKEAMELFGGYVSAKELYLALSANRSEEIFGPRKAQIASRKEKLILRIRHRADRTREWIALKIAPWLRVEDDF